MVGPFAADVGNGPGAVPQLAGPGRAPGANPQSALLALLGGGVQLPQGSIDPGQPARLPPDMRGLEADPEGMEAMLKDMGPGMDEGKDEGGAGEMQELLPILLMLLGGGQGMPGAGGMPGMPTGGMTGGARPMGPGAVPGLPPQQAAVGGRGGY